MSALDSQSLIERYPTELLERIFLFTSARDILRLSLVNHAFYGLIQASPSIQYEIDLFGAGLQPNPRTKTSLADCRVALEAYCRGWQDLDPAEKWDRAFDVTGIREAVAVGGTYGILWSDSAKFFTLGSASRGIQRREWSISFKHIEASSFTFYPQANVMAVVQEVAWTWIIYLNTMSDGEPHPTARNKILSYTFSPGDGGTADILDKSITTSRLVILRGLSSVDVAQIVVWDWTTGQILLELDSLSYRSAKFIDDYWLAFVVAPCGGVAPPTLVLFDTEQTSVNHQTIFHFDLHGRLCVCMTRLHLDRDGYKPSPEEALLAPFHQDVSQRLLAVEFHAHRSVFVMKTEVLLKLARERGGTSVGWEQWNAHAVEVQLEGGMVPWVSGPRLVCISGTGRETDMRMYDFSPREFAKCREEIADGRGGRFLRVILPNVGLGRLLWGGPAIRFPNGSHDSIAFLMVFESGETPPTGAMRVWNF